MALPLNARNLPLINVAVICRVCGFPLNLGEDSGSAIAIALIRGKTVTKYLRQMHNGVQSCSRYGYPQYNTL